MSLFSSIGRFFTGGPAQSTSQTATSGTSNINSTTQTNPYAPTVPYLNDFLSQIGGLYGNGSGISDYEQNGYDALSGAVGTAQGALDPAIAQNNKTLNGDYLSIDSNPYLMDIAKRVGGLAGAESNKTFGMAGRTGSGLHEENFGEGVGNAIGGVLYDNYNTERGRQVGAVGAAPGLAGAALAPSAALIAAGQGISARPYDLAAQYGGTLANIAGLGGTSNTNGVTNTSATSNGSTTGRSESQGVFGKIANSFVNNLFPGG